MLVSCKLLPRGFNVRLFLITILLAYLLSACGHKGPLYIPLPQTGEASRASQNDIEKK